MSAAFTYRQKMDISYCGNKTGFPRPGYINTNKHTAKKETQTLAVTYSCMHTHACPCKQNVHIHLHTHPRTHTRAHTHTHTHTHTHYDTVTPEVQKIYPNIYIS